MRRRPILSYIFLTLAIFTFIVVFSSYHVEREENGIDFPLYFSLPQSRNITCVITSSTDHHMERLTPLMATWPRTCTHIVIATSMSGLVFPFYLFDSYHDRSLFMHGDTSVLFTTYASYSELWGKIMESVNYAPVKDWLLKADDDTFVILDNLEMLLSQYDPKQLIGFGMILRHNITVDGRQREIEYLGGGAGYVLSKATVEKIKTHNSKYCSYPGFTSYEDVNMGLCLNSLGVQLIDSRDFDEKHRFLPYPPWIMNDKSNEWKNKYRWIKDKSKYRMNFGREFTSNSTISFHEIRSEKEIQALQLYLSQ